MVQCMSGSGKQFFCFEWKGRYACCKHNGECSERLLSEMIKLKWENKCYKILDKQQSVTTIWGLEIAEYITDPALRELPV